MYKQANNVLTQSVLQLDYYCLVATNYRCTTQFRILQNTIDIGRITDSVATQHSEY